jgi:two-component system OmpR family response regulator
MSAPRVVVIEHDEWILRLLQDGLRDGGFVVATAANADDGLAKVRDLAPDCVLCEVSLPGKNGYAVALELRADQPPISITPIALLAADDDDHARTATFDAGADALLTRPFKLEEVIAQITALVQLASRMRERRISLIDSLSAGPASSPEGASFRGDLEHMPVASLLTLLELERKTGGISVKSGKRRATMELADGCVVGTTLDGVKMDPVVMLRDTLGWTEGRVTFRAKPGIARPPNARSIRLVLAEARGVSTSASSTRLPAMGGGSVGRMQAIPPPPGRRISANEPPKRPGALEDVPTRRVDVPPTRPKPTEEPPSTKRPK